MAGRRHFNPNTGKMEVCTAKDGNCPFEGQDFTDQKEGEQYADMRNELEVEVEKGNLSRKELDDKLEERFGQHAPTTSLESDKEYHKDLAYSLINEQIQDSFNDEDMTSSDELNAVIEEYIDDYNIEYDANLSNQDKKELSEQIYSTLSMNYQLDNESSTLKNKEDIDDISNYINDKIKNDGISYDMNQVE